MPHGERITFGEMRTSGVRDVLIYCTDYRCSHWIRISADRWSDDVRLSDLELRFVCEDCGHRGADVQPLYDTEAKALTVWKRPPSWAASS